MMTRCISSKSSVSSKNFTLFFAKKKKNYYKHSTVTFRCNLQWNEKGKCIIQPIDFETYVYYEKFLYYFQTLFQQVLTYFVKNTAIIFSQKRNQFKIFLRIQRKEVIEGLTAQSLKTRFFQSLAMANYSLTIVSNSQLNFCQRRMAILVL